MNSRRGVLLTGCLVLATASACKKEEASTGKPAGSSEKTAPAVGAVRVEVAVLEASKGTQSLSRPGEVKGVREANLAAALGGFVEKVLVNSGQRVEEGQVIARVDTSTHSAQWQLAKVESTDAKRELERLQSMGKAIAKARVDAAQARFDRAKAQLQLASTQLSRATIRAPFAGILVGLEVEEGEVLGPGQPIGRLVQLDPAVISVSVADQDVRSLVVGSPARVTTAGTSEAVIGTLARIEPVANLNTRTFLVEVDVPNSGQTLLPGMIAQVAFAETASTGGLLLPQDLLVTQLEENGVFVVSGEKAMWRPLALGGIVRDLVEVKSGLKVGETIVTTGQRGLKDGDELIVTRHGHCCVDGEVVYGKGGSQKKDSVGKNAEKGGPEKGGPEKGDAEKSDAEKGGAEKSGAEKSGAEEQGTAKDQGDAK